MEPGSSVAVFAVGGCISAWTLLNFARDNRTAWLKITMFGWYVVSFGLGIGAVFIGREVPESAAYVSLLFDTLAQLTAWNGVVDVLQFVYSSRRLLFLRETNARFAAIYAAVCAATLLACAAVLALHLTTTNMLTYYRGLSATTILIETSVYAYALYALYRNRRALVYYAAQLVSRVGIIVAVAGLIAGVFDRRTFSIVLVSFVMVAVLGSALTLSRIRPGKRVHISPTPFEKRIRPFQQKALSVCVRASGADPRMRLSQSQRTQGHAQKAGSPLKPAGSRPSSVVSQGGSRPSSVVSQGGSRHSIVASQAGPLSSLASPARSHSGLALSPGRSHSCLSCSPNCQRPSIPFSPTRSRSSLVLSPNRPRPGLALSTTCSPSSLHPSPKGPRVPGILSSDWSEAWPRGPQSSPDSSPRGRRSSFPASDQSESSPSRGRRSSFAFPLLSRSRSLMQSPSRSRASQADFSDLSQTDSRSSLPETPRPIRPRSSSIVFPLSRPHSLELWPSDPRSSLPCSASRDASPTRRRSSLPCSGSRDASPTGRRSSFSCSPTRSVSSALSLVTRKCSGVGLRGGDATSPTHKDGSPTHKGCFDTEKGGEESSSHGTELADSAADDTVRDESERLSSFSIASFSST